MAGMARTLLTRNSTDLELPYCPTTSVASGPVGSFLTDAHPETMARASANPMAGTAERRILDPVSPLFLLMCHPPYFGTNRTDVKNPSAVAPAAIPTIDAAREPTLIAE